MLFLPYGISYFPTLPKDGYYYVDRTPYLAVLEGMAERFLFFLRPRRFGKSLFISTLHHYYGLEFKGRFQEVFGKYHIGRHPTPLANSFLVLNFEFSRIDTGTPERTYSGFTDNVRSGINRFFTAYGSFFPEEKQKAVLESSSPELLLKSLLDLVENNQIAPIYILIDEYDHFANELISFNLDGFQEMVSRNGFVRKFFETIKTGTGTGLVARMFVTGVSPITLDSLTSGFNIGRNVSAKPELHGMMGFTQQECLEIVRSIDTPPAEIPIVMDDLRTWYNGYLFHPKGHERVYNPDMVLYFALEYQRGHSYPETMLDINIASDYGKVKKVFSIGGHEQRNREVLELLVENGEVPMKLTDQFSFEKGFSQNDFLSLLYYMGYLSISRVESGEWLLAPPNRVIKELYFDYFTAVVLPDGFSTDDLSDALRAFATKNDPAPLCALVHQTLKTLSNRDAVHFNEKHVKAIFVSFLTQGNAFLVKSEPEIDRHYADILVLERKPYNMPHQFAIELKYLPKSDADKAEMVKKEALVQLQGYMETEYFKSLPNLKGWVFVVAGTTVISEPLTVNS